MRHQWSTSGRKPSAEADPAAQLCGGSVPHTHPNPTQIYQNPAKSKPSAQPSAHIEMEDAPVDSSTAKRYGGTCWVPMTGPDTLTHPTFSPHPLPHTRPISKVASQKRPPARCVNNAAARKPGRRLASPRVPGASVYPNGPHSVPLSVCGTVCCLDDPPPPPDPHCGASFSPFEHQREHA